MSTPTVSRGPKAQSGRGRAGNHTTFRGNTSLAPRGPSRGGHPSTSSQGPPLSQNRNIPPLKGKAERKSMANGKATQYRGRPRDASILRQTSTPHSRGTSQPSAPNSRSFSIPSQDKARYEPGAVAMNMYQKHMGEIYTEVRKYSPIC